VSTDFRADLESIPDQMETPLRVEGGELPPRRRVFLGGMGGSAAAADFMQLCLRGRRDTHVVRDAALPSWIGPDDMLIVLSYSGETDESLSLWREARSRGLVRAAVASGGSLLRAAREEGCPWVLLPGGLAPRNALGHLLQALRLLTEPEATAAEWKDAVLHLRAVRDLVREGGPPVPAVIEALEETELPVLLAGDAAALVAAHRWRASLAENAKVPATVWELPEASHNRIVTAGRDGPRRRALGLLALGEPREARPRERWEAVLTALLAHGARPVRVLVPHASPWIEALGLAYLGDLMSVHLADHLEVDPEPLSLMTDVKSRLRFGKELAP
jgi:glucose/mannose-6-phosphate isomerase